MVVYQRDKLNYSVEIEGLDQKQSFYLVKVYAVNTQGQVIGVSTEVTGSRSNSLCVGVSAVPRNLRTYYVGASSITYEWDNPVCNEEQYDAIEGFEFSVSFFYNIGTFQIAYILLVDVI